MAPSGRAKDQREVDPRNAQDLERVASVHRANPLIRCCARGEDHPPISEQ